MHWLHLYSSGKSQTDLSAGSHELEIKQEVVKGTVHRDGAG